MINTNTNSTVAVLRGIMPQRRLSPWEAKRVAETQAAKLRQLIGDASPNFDIEAITNLPRIVLNADPALRASGSTQWDRGAWRIRINTSEPPVRQRFTLAHEFKHILDAPALDTSYSSISEQIDGQQQIEAICDYFAACLLMPKRWVKRLWGEGTRNLASLAAVFSVSTAAMKRRLTDLGLVERTPRSLTIPHAPDWTRSIRTAPHQTFYRTPAPLITAHALEAA